MLAAGRVSVSLLVHGALEAKGVKSQTGCSYVLSPAHSIRLALVLLPAKGAGLLVLLPAKGRTCLLTLHKST